MNRQTVLIDADITAYQVCVNAEVEWDWGDDVWTLHSDRAVVRGSFKEAIDTIIEATEADAAILAFTGPDNFRKSILPEYKGHRSGRKPMNYAYLKEWAATQWDTKQIPTLEGDDVLGILGSARDDFFIYSADKDLKTVPAMLWSNDERFVYRNSVEVADWWFMYQTLTGDTTDGYKGCPGIGPKKAEQILGPQGQEPIEVLWQRVVEAYESKDLTSDDALVQARCARILRNTDYTNNEVQLWTPPTS